MITDVRVEGVDLDAWFASSRILSGTGHRPDKLNREYDLVGPYTTAVRQQLQDLFKLLQPQKIISGMALGFDQILAQEAILAQIPVLAAVPCDDQEKIWPRKSQDLYNSLMKNELVTPYVVCPGPYHASKMQIRNRWMCDNSNGLIACWLGDNSGGTYNCVRYAREINMKIWYLKLSRMGDHIIQKQLFD